MRLPGSRQLVPDDAAVRRATAPPRPTRRPRSADTSPPRRLTLQSAPVSIHAISRPPEPYNEPIKSYAPGSPEREELRSRLNELAGQTLELPLVIGGKDVQLPQTFDQVMPHDKEHVLAKVSKGDASHVQQAIDAAADAWHDWSRTPWEERAAVFLRAAELLAGPWRSTLNAATMLGQSKTAHQAEIDAACELIDFWRFNVEFMTRIYEEQPISSPGVWNRLEYRPLEGFVFAVTPFNFTAIGGNLPTAPALMGNTVVWKPASTAAYSAHFLMQLLQEAGLPDGRDQPRLRLRRRDRRRRAREPATSPASTSPARPASSRGCGRRSATEHRQLPQLPAHRRRDRRQGLHRRARVGRRRRARDRDRARRLRVPGAEVLGRVARVRRRQPLARAARAARDRDRRAAGRRRRDFGNFMGAVIDGNSFKTQATGDRRGEGKGDDRRRRRLRRLEGWFVEPTVVETDDPDFRLMRRSSSGRSSPRSSTRARSTTRRSS